MEVIALDRDGETRARHRVPTPTSGYEDCIRAVVDLVASAESTAGERGSVGIGIPGSPNPRTGIVRNSNAVLINGKPLGRDLAAALGREVRLANDANCLAVSEAVDGAGKDAGVVFGVIVGTGHEDDAGDDRDRKFRRRQIVLQRHDQARAEQRPDQRSDAAEKRHQDDLAGHLPADVGQRRELEDERLQTAGKPGKRR